MRKRALVLFKRLQGKKIPAVRKPDGRVEAYNSSPLCQCQCRR